MVGAWLKTDLNAMLNLDEFGVLASWMPSGDAVAHRAVVVLSEPDMDVLDRSGVLPAVTITMEADKFPGVDVDDVIVADDRRFVVTLPAKRLGSGNLKVLACAELTEYEAA